MNPLSDRAERRRVLRSAALLTGLPTALAACTGDFGVDGYDAAVRRIWQSAPFDRSSDGPPRVQRELVRCATLAPSSHNSQCWRFALSERAIEIRADPARRCPVVDPDDHHLHVSLGCAAENLLLAARANGLQGRMQVLVEPGSPADAPRPAGARVAIALEAATARASPLYRAIAGRQCSRSVYDGQPIPADERRLLEQAGRGDGVSVRLITEPHVIERLLELAIAGNTVQLTDRAFLQELKSWMRFNGDEAVRHGDGLYTGCSGRPSMPSWLGSRLFDVFLTADGENDTLVRQVRSSAGLAVFVSERDDPAHWIEAGRCYQRFALQATALGIRNAMLNMPVEVAALRPRVAAELGLGSARPDLLVRFGRGPILPRSLRRPVASVSVSVSV